MSDSRLLASAVQTAVRLGVEGVQPYTAVVTAVTTSAVQIRLPEAAAGDDEEYARLAGVRVAVGDKVIVLSVSGTPFVVGRAKSASDPVPNHALGGAAGAGATLALLGRDEAFRAVLVTGSSGLAAGLLFTITFNRAWPTNEFRVIPGALDSDSATAMNKVFVNYLSQTTTTFEFHTNAALPASTSHIWSFHVEEGA